MYWLKIVDKKSDNKSLWGWKWGFSLGWSKNHSSKRYARVDKNPRIIVWTYSCQPAFKWNHSARN